MTRLDLIYQRHNNRRPRGELPPVNAPPTPTFEQCSHGGDFEPRCQEPGTWKTPERFLRRRFDGSLEWPQERYQRRCSDHRRAYDERVEEM